MDWITFGIYWLDTKPWSKSMIANLQSGVYRSILNENPWEIHVFERHDLFAMMLPVTCRRSLPGSVIWSGGAAHLSSDGIISLQGHYTPASKKLKVGYTGFTSSVRPSARPSVRPSVRPSKGYCNISVCPPVCGQNRVRSVSYTILVGSISYLHILSSNFRRYVACKGYCNIAKFKILANFWNL